MRNGSTEWSLVCYGVFSLPVFLLRYRTVLVLMMTMQPYNVAMNGYSRMMFKNEGFSLQKNRPPFFLLLFSQDVGGGEEEVFINFLWSVLDGYSCRSISQLDSMVHYINNKTKMIFKANQIYTT